MASNIDLTVEYNCPNCSKQYTYTESDSISIYEHNVEQHKCICGVEFQFEIDCNVNTDIEQIKHIAEVEHINVLLNQLDLFIRLTVQQMKNMSGEQNN